MSLGPMGMGPVSRQFLWKIAQLGQKTGAAQWVDKFWTAIKATDGAKAANFYRTIVHCIKENAGKPIAAELEPMLPEMQAALRSLGIEITEDVLKVVVAEGTGVSSGAILGFVVAALLIALAYKAAYGEEAPPVPRQVPPPFRGNPHIDPVARLKMELDSERLLHTYRFLGNVH